MRPLSPRASSPPGFPQERAGGRGGREGRGVISAPTPTSPPSPSQAASFLPFSTLAFFFPLPETTIQHMALRPESLVYRERRAVLFSSLARSLSSPHSLFSVQCAEEAVSVQCTEVPHIKAITCKRERGRGEGEFSLSFSLYWGKGGHH